MALHEPHSSLGKVLGLFLPVEVLLVAGAHVVSRGIILTFIHNLLYTKYVFSALSVLSLIITINLLSKYYNYHFYR